MKKIANKFSFFPIFKFSLVLIIFLTSCQENQKPEDQLLGSNPANSGVAEEVEPTVVQETASSSDPGEGSVEEVNECLDCHTDQQILMDSADPVSEGEGDNPGESMEGEVIPLAAWEKVWIDDENFLATVHGKISCQTCHQGEQSEEKEIAHKDLIAFPSDDPDTYCGECHPNLTAIASNNLHTSLDGYWTVLSSRGISKNHPPAEEMFDNHCQDCHASCGDCHVSRPTSVDGGFINGHIFQAEPSMTENCTACHGSRVGDEYLGKHEDLSADIHYRQGNMTCVDCHTGNEMHGQTANCQECHEGPEASQVAPSDHRYDGLQSPSCESCHAPVAAGNDGILMHEQHSGTLSCQVCHSISYSSCEGCHVSVSEDTGRPVFALESSYLGFNIGKNPIQTYARPYEYVPVRHVPVTETSFDYYEAGMVSNFSNKETWVYTTPHNIQRNTPQTESCENCHGNPDIFLTVDDIAPGELEANSDVIVEEIPPLPY